MRFWAPVPILWALLSLASPADAQLLGLEDYLPAPKVEFSADITMTSDGDTTAGKLMRGRDKERREFAVEGDTETIIIRFDKGVVWSLSPDDKMYLETSLDEALGRVAGPDGKAVEPQLNFAPLGADSVDGIPAAKQKVTGKDVDGTPIEATIWTSEDGIVVRVDNVIVDDDGVRHDVRMQLHNLHITPQDPSLFEIPAGYRRIQEMQGGKLGSLDLSHGIASL